MAVSPEQVLQVAALARLRVEPSEVEALSAELTAILDHVASMAEVCVPDELVATNLDPLVAPLRADQSAPHIPVVRPEDNAPAWREGFFLVPRVAALDAPAIPPNPADE